MKYSKSYFQPSSDAHFDHIVDVLEKAGVDVEYCRDKGVNNTNEGIYVHDTMAFCMKHEQEDYVGENNPQGYINRTNDPEFRLTDVKRPISEEIVYDVPTTSPYDEDTTSATNGAKEGDKFIAIAHEENYFLAGTIITLDWDDGTNCPKFKAEEGATLFVNWYCLAPVEDNIEKNVEKELDNTSKPVVSEDTTETKEEYVTVNKEDPTKFDIKAGRIIKLDDALDYEWAEPVDGTYKHLGTTTGRITSKKTLKELI